MATEGTVGKNRDSAVSTIANVADEAKLADQRVNPPDPTAISICKSLAAGGIAGGVAFLVEAEWFGSGNLPSAEEYLRNGIVSSGVHIVLVHIFFLLGQALTNENVEAIIDTIPGIVSAPATILQLWDDLGNAKYENQQGNDGSYVNCVMMEHHQEYYLCIERAREHAMSRICDAWKSLNKESLLGKTRTPFPKAFTKASPNLSQLLAVHPFLMYFGFIFLAGLAISPSLILLTILYLFASI